MHTNVKQWKFPAGEIGVQVVRNDNAFYNIDLNFSSSDDIISMLLKVDAIRRMQKDASIYLYCKYLPYARQDRVMNTGESLSLKVIADLINSCNFGKVVVCDTHSSVADALLNNVEIVEQVDCIASVISKRHFDYDAIIAPDAGSIKKASKVADYYGVPVIQAHKSRDVTNGNITKVSIVDSDYSFIKGKKILVVDDICDGGATFINLAKILPESTLGLYVTHGIFSKGKEELYKYYSNIFCYNDMQKGEVK